MQAVENLKLEMFSKMIQPRKVNLILVQDGVVKKLIFSLKVINDVLC